MKLTKKQIALEEGLQKEWLITNGIGGFSSSTVLGCNTRKYHGLLVAPIAPPGRRHLFLSKLDESITVGEKEYPLYTNVCRQYISEGHKYLEEFEKDYFPIFTYKVEDIEIKKVICMEYGKNTVCILYKIKNGKKKSKIKIAPIVNFRDFHHMSTNREMEVKQEIRGTKIKAIIDENSHTPFYIYCDQGEYIKHNNDYFRNMYYIEEEKRGFYPEENHVVIGRYEIDLNPEEEKEISVVASLEENIEPTDVKEIINKEIIRINELMIKSGLIDTKSTKLTSDEKRRNELIKNYIIASDNFVIYRPSFRTHSLIAGYPWFLDWGRDALLSFEGILLKSKRYDIAKEVLLTFSRDIKFGLVPNGYSGYDNRPLYNSADASLILIDAVKRYLNYTGDKKFIEKNLYNKLIQIIEAYANGIDLDSNNIYLDSDFLIVSGTEKTQNTWMDVKYGDFPATPRNGKAVEINSLWYNALKIMEEISIEIEEKENASRFAELARKCKLSFIDKFYNKRRKCLYDVLGDSKIRPNQIASICLSYPIIDPESEIGKQVFEVITKKLLNKYGLKTLAKGEKNYIEVYEGDSFKRDMSYHQGITWTWLLGMYFDAMRNRIKFAKTKTRKKELEEELQKFIQETRKTYIKEFQEKGMIGSLAELHDSKAPFAPKGAPAQCWSVAEVFRIIL